MSFSSKINIVMVNTTHPGNIGAAARAMKNMCLQQLVLVSPEKFPHAEATSRASGADDVLQQATVFEDLDDALAGSDLIVGASARLRRLTWPQLTPAQCVEKIINEPQLNKISILFGREHSGLTNEELERCHYLVHIPSNPEYSSLNVASAVQIIAYEVLKQNQDLQSLATNAPAVVVHKKDVELAEAHEMEGFYDHLFGVLTGIGFLNEEHPRKMMRRLRRLFNRSRPDKVELNILRGILSMIQKKLKS